MKAVKITVKAQFLEGFIQLVDELLKVSYDTDDDRMVMAALVEIRARFYNRLGKCQTEYSLHLTPVQAFAVRILYTDFINDPTSYMGSKLFVIANDVEKTYAK